MTSLISIGDLISNGLKDIQATWKPTLKYTVWFLVAPAIFMVAIWLPFLLASFVDASPGPSMLILFFLGYSIMLFGLFWAGVALMRAVIEHVQGRNTATSKSKRSTLSYLPNLLWVCVLISAPIVASWIVAYLPLFFASNARMAGMLMAGLFLVAIGLTIWISIIFSQAYILVLTDEATGIGALKRSYAMVKGRWWKTLWRHLVPKLVFQLIVGLVMGLFYGIIFALGFALFGSWAASSGIGQELGVEAVRASNVGFGALGIVFVVLIALAGLALLMAQIVAQTIYQASVAARLFFSLKQTKAK